MAFGTLISLCLVISSALATPVQIRSSPITLPIAVNINATGGAQALINRDRARAQALFSHGQAKAEGKGSAHVHVSVTDAGQLYTASVGVGAGTYTLIVDTGSSNTWVGAAQAYHPGPNSYNTGHKVSVSYGSGNFSGEEFLDTVKLGSASIYGQSIGVASTAKGFGGIDGIVGIGPTDLTRRTVTNTSTVPTVTDNMKSQGIIGAEVLGVSFVPTTSTNNEINGELDFGGTDSRKYTGDVSFVPITKTSPAKTFWGIEQSITLGSATGQTILSHTAGIVDTGTTLVLIATDAFKAYQSATGSTLDQKTGLLTVPNESYLKSLFFNIGKRSFEFTANAQIFPRALNSQIGGNPGQIYLIVADIGTPSGQGLDFINGFAFLQRFYSVYDTDNSQVGLATTSHTYDTTN